MVTQNLEDGKYSVLVGNGLDTRRGQDAENAGYGGSLRSLLTLAFLVLSVAACTPGPSEADLTRAIGTEAGKGWNVTEAQLISTSDIKNEIPGSILFRGKAVLTSAEKRYSVTYESDLYIIATEVLAIGEVQEVYFNGQAQPFRDSFRLKVVLESSLPAGELESSVKKRLGTRELLVDGSVRARGLLELVQGQRAYLKTVKALSGGYERVSMDISGRNRFHYGVFPTTYEWSPWLIVSKGARNTWLRCSEGSLYQVAVLWGGQREIIGDTFGNSNISDMYKTVPWSRHPYVEVRVRKNGEEGKCWICAWHPYAKNGKEICDVSVTELASLRLRPVMAAHSVAELDILNR